MTLLSVDLPEGVTVDDARFELAAALYVSGRITQGQAADVAGLTRATFLELCARRGVPVTNITAEDFERELATWERRRSATAPR